MCCVNVHVDKTWTKLWASHPKLLIYSDIKNTPGVVPTTELCG
mgnify:FL=1